LQGKQQKLSLREAFQRITLARHALQSDVERLRKTHHESLFYKLHLRCGQIYV